MLTMFLRLTLLLSLHRTIKSSQNRHHAYQSTCLLPLPVSSERERERAHKTLVDIIKFHTLDKNQETSLHHDTVKKHTILFCKM